MGVNKDTKIYYKYDLREAALTGAVTKTTVDDNAGGTMDTYVFRNAADDADIRTDTMKNIFLHTAEAHSKNNFPGVTKNGKGAYAESIMALKVWGSVDEAKAAIFDDAILTAYDTHADRQEWALVDGNKGLKHTKDWKIQDDSSGDSHWKQFKDAVDGRWVSGDGEDYLKLGAIITDNDSHIF